MASKRSLAHLSVWLGQTLVGTITELPNDRNLFVFDEGYAANSDRPVLSLSFYDAEGNLNTEPIATQMKLPRFFSNLLPEAALREYVAQRAGVKSSRDLPLLQLLGEDLPGAVVVRAEDDGPPPEAFEEAPLPEPSDVETKPLRFSLAGVQMKFSAGGSPERGLTIPAEGRGGHWIIKLDDAFRESNRHRHRRNWTGSREGNRTATPSLSARKRERALGETV
jgi:serine/threonine-protein kinase HipA